ncbi:hypothetical protein KMZ68_18905 [Bradyrhizobium sediminis]|uniref:Polysaccharide chain length determinant N-terminal domain-containing protein n=1 Tax=Bradyrhizobium sediminis TaxID=2840469 RepID=A0A975NM18_9BRAD|nr:hypothetical protein [Bradyrhizobium sediminis]QWG17036.1 hypothetical protein KMZ68_18905 [Bradyrhizobium sediminis]
MNQNFPSTQGSLSQQEPPTSAEADPWALLLDSLLVILRHWKLLIIGPLIAGAVAYAGSLLLPKSYRSYAYVGPLEEAMAKRSSTLIPSPVVVDAVLRKLSQRQPFSSMPPEEGRSYLASRIQFRPVQGADSRSSSLYVLEVLDAEPSRARDILTATVDSWLAAMKPPPEKLASLQRLREALEVQSADLSTAIAQLMAHPELFRPDIKTGYAPVNVADLIKLRTDGVAKSEELRSIVEGPGHDAIVLPPTMPVDPVAPAKGRIALVAAAIMFAGLVVILLFREVLVPALACSKYALGLRRLGGLFRREESAVG